VNAFDWIEVEQRCNSLPEVHRWLNRQNQEAFDQGQARIAALEAKNAALKRELETRDSERIPCICCGEPVSWNWDDWLRDGSKELWHLECARKWLARLSDNFLTFGQSGANFEEAQRLAYQCDADFKVMAENAKLRAVLSNLTQDGDVFFPGEFGGWQCWFCRQGGEHYTEVGHTDECPVGEAWALLAKEVAS
jgi:hypothetical protein